MTLRDLCLASTFGALALLLACDPPPGVVDDDDDGTTDDDDIADDDDSTPPAAPVVVETSPWNGALDVALDGFVSATFSEAMNAGTIDALSFTVTYGDPAVPVPGTVMYADAKAFFWPAALLPSDTVFYATVAAGVESASGVGLVLDHIWSFTTGDSAVVPDDPVDLGGARGFAILAKSAISTVPGSAVTGNLGLSPAAASYITGFSLTLDGSTEFATSMQVIGQVLASDYAPPTPELLLAAVGDMELAFTDAAGRAPDVTELGAGNIGGMTLPAGVYKWGTGLLIPTDVTLSGGATDVWIFQIAQSLTMSSGARVGLIGGALPQNVFWQVSGDIDLGTTAHIAGVLLCQTAITLRTGATVDGRLLAQTAVAIAGSTITEPTP